MSAEIQRATPGAVPAVAQPNKMYRRRTGRAVAGVAGGLADHLGVDVLWVRLAFAVLAALGGAGVLAYGLLWAFVRQEAPGTPVRTLSAKERQQAYGLVALGVGLAVAVGTLSGAASGWVIGTLGVALVGTALVWREADESRRRRMRDGARTGLAAVLGSGGRKALMRMLTGAALVVSGIALFLYRSINLDQMQFALLAVLATLVGVAVLTVPFWLRLVRDLGEERTARIREHERAEIAAHLHDSVLQTLALIQKHTEAPREVLRLARGQERQLREWLYPSKADGDAAATLSDALRQAAGEVEDSFAVKIDQVVVGDCPLDEPLTALVHAAREAMVNAAKHAEVSEFSVYAEVEPDKATVFVRDRGKGFDQDSVSDDRHGLADSIRGRMERNGGDVRLRTSPGEGTEVQLHMPRAKAASRRD
ncbi:MAG TPA: PspC domain-containing protein [Actinophytocola sp.]|uniref:PspC domain-containing protein n=1 Tax=Actinophytocola sp. TaxID=1872138 RepID=UPI002DDD89B4|nr:PspC domain-containing protein [Actinophytocola sp.]HEV2779148.1 PspC domain-containing protein [Actinophytocola sp.]